MGTEVFGVQTGGQQRPKKYELVRDQTMALNDGTVLYRVRALRDFGTVKAEDFGGYIAFGHNLSQKGDCWVADNAQVYGTASILGNAWVGDDAQVYGDAVVIGRARIGGASSVGGAATIDGTATIAGDTSVTSGTLSGGDHLDFHEPLPSLE